MYLLTLTSNNIVALLRIVKLFNLSQNVRDCQQDVSMTNNYVFGAEYHMIGNMPVQKKNCEKISGWRTFNSYVPFLQNVDMRKSMAALTDNTIHPFSADKPYHHSYWTKYALIIKYGR